MTAFKNRGLLAGAALIALVTLPGGLVALAEAQSPERGSMREQIDATEVVYIPGLAATPRSQVAEAAVTAPEVVPSPPATAPTPAAVPAPAQRTSGCPPLIEEALGTAGCMVSFCESGWNPNATGAAGEMGWFQISPRWHADATYDPAGNVAAAARISAGGTDWSQWTAANVLFTGVCPTGVRYPG